MGAAAAWWLRCTLIFDIVSSAKFLESDFDRKKTRAPISMWIVENVGNETNIDERVREAVFSVGSYSNTKWLNHKYAELFH